MDRSHDKVLLKKILTRYDQLGFIRKQIFESKHNTSSLERLRRQSRQKIEEINREFKEHEFKGPISTLLKKYRLNKYELIIILALLRQRLVSSDPHLSGRDILHMIFDDSYNILRGMAFIDTTSMLVSAGIAIPELSNATNEEVLETKFRLSDRVFNMVYDTFASSPGWKPMRLKTKGDHYRTNLSLLMDYRKLIILYQIS